MQIKAIHIEMFLEGDLQIVMNLQRHNLRLLVRLLTDHVLLTDHLVKIGTDALCQTCGEKEKNSYHLISWEVSK